MCDRQSDRHRPTASTTHFVARLVLVNCLHHVTTTTNHRQVISVSKMDAMDTGGTTSKACAVEYVREHAFEVAPRYTDLSYIGEGAYGMVVYVYFVLRFICFQIQWQFLTVRSRCLVDLLSILLFPRWQKCWETFMQLMVVHLVIMLHRTECQCQSAHGVNVSIRVGVIKNDNWLQWSLGVPVA